MTCCSSTTTGYLANAALSKDGRLACVVTAVDSTQLMVLNATDGDVLIQNTTIAVGISGAATVIVGRSTFIPNANSPKMTEVIW